MTIERKDSLDDLLIETGESVASIDADPEAAFTRMIREQRRLIAHLPESAPMEDFESALGVNGVLFGSGFVTKEELDVRANSILSQ